MSDRNELARVILENDEDGTLGGFTLADVILAAGYRKPRQVTTTEELDALPDRSVILTNAGTIANLIGGMAYFFGYGRPSSRTLLALPATVLYEPQP